MEKHPWPRLPLTMLHLSTPLQEDYPPSCLISPWIHSLLSVPTPYGSQYLLFWNNWYFMFTLKTVCTVHKTVPSSIKEILKIFGSIFKFHFGSFPEDHFILWSFWNLCLTPNDQDGRQQSAILGSGWHVLLSGFSEIVSSSLLFKGFYLDCLLGTFCWVGKSPTPLGFLSVTQPSYEMWRDVAFLLWSINIGPARKGVLGSGNLYKIPTQISLYHGRNLRPLGTLAPFFSDEY